MCKRKGFFKKLLAVTAIVGGAAVLISKLKGNHKETCPEDCYDDESLDDESSDTSARNYVPISHGQEESAPETASEKTAPSPEEIASKLEQAVAETEARYEEAAKEAVKDQEK